MPGKKYLTEQAATFLKFAMATTDPDIAAGFLEKAAEPERVLRRLARRQPPAAQQPLERRAVDELHGDVEVLAVLAVVVDRHDVVVVEAGRGHVINIGSTAAHVVAPRGHIYAATKHAVRALSEGMNIDLAGTAVKVSLIDPGYVKTEFGVVRFLGDVDRAMETYRGFQPLDPADVADAIFYVASLPEHVNITDLVIVPRAQRHMYVIDRNSE